TRRTPPRRARPLSAIAGRARPCVRHMERPVRALSSARRARAHARASRSAVRGEERDMSGRRFALALLAALLLAGCDTRKEPTFQGWVEAELIFVGPDETGRVETLTVREGAGRARHAAVHHRSRSAAGRRRHAGGGGEERAAGLRPRATALEDAGRDAKK